MRKKVDTPSLQEDLTEDDLNRFRQAAVVAVDCEMTGLNPHRDLLCLVQICDRSGTVRIVRTQHWRDAQHLKALMQDAAVVKIFHFAIMDCAFLMQSLGVEVNNAYCTKIASKLARTYTEEHSLVTLVKEILGVELNKSEQSSFWLAEVLTAKQLTYAANDVLYLIELRERLSAMLERKGALPTGVSYVELNQSCQQFIPALVHLWVNGWDFGRQERSAAAVFGR